MSEDLTTKKNNKTVEKETKKEIVPIVSRPYTEADIDGHAARVAGRRNLRDISILTDGGEYQFDYLIKKPSRSVITAITDKKGKKDGADLNEVAKLLLGCVLEGDREAYEHDGSIYEELINKVSELAYSAEGHLKKL